MMFEEIDKETIELFQELADGREKDPILNMDVSKSFKFLPKFICPNLVGEDFELIRQSTLLMMVTQRDTAQSRMRLHSLFVGLPGSGKTAFMLDWNEHFDGVFINGEHASKAGLCGDARGSGTPGLLTTFTNNVILLDEADKMTSKDQSVVGTTPVIIRKNDKIKIVNIEDASNYTDFETLSVNPHTLKNEWKKVYKVSKHKENRKILEIKTLRKKKVVATQDHSFLKYDFTEDKLVPIKGSDLKKGNLLPFISNIPNDTTIHKYQLIKDYIGIEELREKAHIDRNRLKKILPFNKYEKEGSRGWHIPYDDARKICPNLENKKMTTPFTYDFGFLVGFWLAEGDIDEKRENIRWSQKDKELLKYVQDTLKKLPKYGTNYSGGFIAKSKKKNYKDTNRLVVKNKYLHDFLLMFIDKGIYNSSSGVGRCAKSKLIPSFCYNCSKEFISGLLSGYFTGDGTANPSDVSAKTVSKQLAQGTSLLLYRLGIGNHIIEQKPTIKKYSLAYKIFIPCHFYKKFYENISFKNERKQKMLELRLKNNVNNDRTYIPIVYKFFKENTKGMFSKKNKNLDLIQSASRGSRKGQITKNNARKFNNLIKSKELKKLIDSNIFWLPIEKIEKISCDSFVYDFSVEDNENFVLANGMVVHNSGLLQAMGEGQYTITKGKIHETYPAEVRVIASANKVNKIQSPLLDRFDFVYHLDTPKRKERADTIPKIVDNFFGEVDKKKTKTVELYLKWIEDFKPEVVKDDLKIIYKFLQTYITDTHTDIDKISRRNLEYSILRISYALAKLERKNITKNHMKQAILFKDKILSKYKMGRGVQ